MKPGLGIGLLGGERYTMYEGKIPTVPLCLLLLTMAESDVLDGLPNRTAPCLHVMCFPS